MGYQFTIENSWLQITFDRQRYQDAPPVYVIQDCLARIEYLYLISTFMLAVAEGRVSFQRIEKILASATVHADDNYHLAALYLRDNGSKLDIFYYNGYLRISRLQMNSPLSVDFKGIAEALKTAVEIFDKHAWKRKKEEARHLEISNQEEERHSHITNELQEQNQILQNQQKKIEVAKDFLDLISKAKQTGLSDEEIDQMKGILLHEGHRVAAANDNDGIEVVSEPTKKNSLPTTVSNNNLSRRKQKRRT